ncbi:MAG: hypothetical protein Q8Q09_11255 [Deltaproteobacteria bacterium]|nr:hypothetical protein [Deltaproteobacteria bacterium]
MILGSARVLALDKHFAGGEQRNTEHQSSSLARALLRSVCDGHETMDDRDFDSMLSFALWGRNADSDAIHEELVATPLA